jgi:hypothetical protein
MGRDVKDELTLERGERGDHEPSHVAEGKSVGLRTCITKSQIKLYLKYIVVPPNYRFKELYIKTIDLVLECITKPHIL